VADRTDSPKTRVAMAIDVEVLEARLRRVIDVFEADGGMLWRVLEHIAEHPHRALRTETPLVSPGLAENLRAERIGETALEPDAMALTERRPHYTDPEKGRRWRFLRVIDERQVITYDTVPNRFAAHFLRTVAREVRRTLRLLERASAPLDEELELVVEDAKYVLRRVRAALDGTDALTHASRITDVPIGNLVLRHDPYYRHLLSAYLELL